MREHPADAERLGFRQRQGRRILRPTDGRRPSACSSATSGTSRTGSSARTRCRSFAGCARSKPFPSRALVREREELEASRGPIEGRVIAVDVGEAAAADGDVHQRSALALVDALRAVGADPELLVTDDDAAAPSDRARLANEAGAAASITVDLAAARRRGRRRSRLLVLREQDHALPFWTGSRATHPGRARGGARRVRTGPAAHHRTSARDADAGGPGRTTHRSGPAGRRAAPRSRPADARRPRRRRGVGRFFSG